MMCLKMTAAAADKMMKSEEPCLSSSEMHQQIRTKTSSDSATSADLINTRPQVIHVVSFNTDDIRHVLPGHVLPV